MGYHAYPIRHMVNKYTETKGDSMNTKAMAASNLAKSYDDILPRILPGV